MSAGKYYPTRIVRGKVANGYDGRRDLYIAVNIGGASFFSAISKEDVEGLRASIADLDADDPDKAEATTEAAE